MFVFPSVDMMTQKTRQSILLKFFILVTKVKGKKATDFCAPIVKPQIQMSKSKAFNLLIVYI